jgi:hypothetical protein
METTIHKRPENDLPGEAWAKQLAQACQLATSASLFPALAALQHARLLSADVAAVGEVAAAQRGCYWEGIRTFFPVETPETPREKVRQEPRRMPSAHESEIEELKNALLDYEESRGDWSKAR